MNGDEGPREYSESDLQRILVKLEDVLTDLDLFKLHLPGAYVSHAIEHLRSLLDT